MATTTAPSTFAGKTGDEWRQQARDCYTRREESFDRCDTDGYLSQWAEQQLATRYLHCAEIADNGGTVTRPALFDLDGNPVPAREIETRYGYAWALLDPENPGGRFLGFFNPSQAQDDRRRIANNAKRGYYIGLARYRAELNPRTYYIEPTGDILDILDNGK